MVSCLVNLGMPQHQRMILRLPLNSVVQEFEMKGRKILRSRDRTNLETKQAAIRERKLKILVIDDHRSVGEGIAQWLADEFGADAVSVDSGYDAVDSVNQNTYNCIFLDLMMPRMNGVKTFLKLKDRIDPRSVVMMSADADCPEWAEAKKLGFEPIEKPFTEDPERIAEILQRY